MKGLGIMMQEIRQFRFDHTNCEDLKISTSY